MNCSTQKCDAKRPFCNTCRIAGKELECEYDDELRQSVTTALLLRTQELEQRLAMYETQPPQMPETMSMVSTPFAASSESPIQLFDFTSPSGMPPGKLGGYRCRLYAHLPEQHPSQDQVPFLRNPQ